MRPQRHETATITDRLDQADSLARPFRRRLRNTERPALVDIRLRKPWFLARLRTLGWNVRFTLILLRNYATSAAQAATEGGAAS